MVEGVIAAEEVGVGMFVVEGSVLGVLVVEGAKAPASLSVFELSTPDLPLVSVLSVPMTLDPPPTGVKNGYLTVHSRSLKFRRSARR